jgi:hypothetical protein
VINISERVRTCLGTFSYLNHCLLGTSQSLHFFESLSFRNITIRSYLRAARVIISNIPISVDKFTFEKKRTYLVG